MQNNRIKAETAHSAKALSRILDSLDALVYVADMQTYELLYMNAYGRRIWGEADGRKCWQIIQQGQSGPCAFCTNPRLFDNKGRPAEPVVWEFCNTVNKRWYQCRDQAIEWPDGRLVRLEIATDITERKHMEQALEAATEKARALALTDELTGLHNRRAFFSHGKQMIHQARRSQTPVSLIMLDADHFKHINDEHGHSVGDQALRLIGHALQRRLRESDLCGRLGGEEFAILLPDTPGDQAAHLAEMLRREVASLRITLETTAQVSCSASLGVASGQGCALSLEHLLSCADQAMYRAKRHGRNRVTRAD